MTDTTQDFSDLTIPEEPGVYWCWRHRKVKTRLRCGRCEKPICPKCTVMGPTGARCRECASNRTQHIYRVSPVQFALTFVASAILSVVGVTLLQAVGFFLLFFAPVIGTLLSKIINMITRGKRGPALATVASLGAALGGLVPVALQWLIFSQVPPDMPPGMPPDPASSISLALLPQLGYVLIYLALVIPAIWYWIK